jgi:hypothetical protein
MDKYRFNLLFNDYMIRSSPASTIFQILENMLDLFSYRSL